MLSGCETYLATQHQVILLPNIWYANQNSVGIFLFVAVSAPNIILKEIRLPVMCSYAPLPEVML